MTTVRATSAKAAAAIRAQKLRAEAEVQEELPEVRAKKQADATKDAILNDDMREHVYKIVTDPNVQKALEKKKKGSDNKWEKGIRYSSEIGAKVQAKHILACNGITPENQPGSGRGRRQYIDPESLARAGAARTHDAYCFMFKKVHKAAWVGDGDKDQSVNVAVSFFQKNGNVLDFADLFAGDKLFGYCGFASDLCTDKYMAKHKYDALTVVLRANPEMFIQLSEDYENWALLGLMDSSTAQARVVSHVPPQSVQPPQATFRRQQRAGKTKSSPGRCSFPTDPAPPPQLGRCTCNDMVDAASTTSRELRRNLDVASTLSTLRRRRRRCIDRVVAGASTKLRRRR